MKTKDPLKQLNFFTIIETILLLALGALMGATVVLVFLL